MFDKQSCVFLLIWNSKNATTFGLSLSNIKNRITQQRLIIVKICHIDDLKFAKIQRTIDETNYELSVIDNRFLFSFCLYKRCMIGRSHFKEYLCLLIYCSAHILPFHFQNRNSNIFLLAEKLYR